MLIARTARPKRKLNLSSTKIRLLLAPELDVFACDGEHSLSCHKPEDQTKNDCVVPGRLVSLARSVIKTCAPLTPKPLGPQRTVRTRR